MSALPPKADIGCAWRDVRFVPKADNIDDVVIIDVRRRATRFLIT